MNRRMSGDSTFPFPYPPRNDGALRSPNRLAALFGRNRTERAHLPDSFPTWNDHVLILSMSLHAMKVA